MNVIQCSNGHFFDGDTYKVCPLCGAPVKLITPQPQNKPKKRKWLFGPKKEPKETDPNPYDVDKTAGDASESDLTDYDGSEFEDGNTPTEDIPKEYEADIDASKKKKEVTLDFWQTDPSANNDAVLPDPPAPPAEKELPKEKNEKNDDNPAEDQSFNDQPVKDLLVKDQPVNEQREDHVEQKSNESLLSQVRSASASSDGKTMSYFSAVAGGTQSEKAAEKPRGPIDPVVGWLVCVQGEHFGESFNIGAGMNSIGRSAGNRIVLDRDMTVSREKHAFIIYEPKYRQFYVKPGDSTGLTYINDKYITETKSITAKDIIQLGNSMFIFIPLCGEDFSWEDYMKG